MTFDLHALDYTEGYDHDAVDAYQEALIDLFLASPEGIARRKEDPDIGFWAGNLIEFGFSYEGVSLPQMDVDDVEEIVERLFPRKISLEHPDNADDTIPELQAFWRFLGREFRLPQARSILRYLDEIAPSFKHIMNDPSKFGMAKSFATMANNAGFDITNEDEMQAFVRLYNSSLLAEMEDSSSEPSFPSRSFPSLPDSSFPRLPSLLDEPSTQTGTRRKKKNPKKSKARKAARKARKRNRKKKR